MLQLCEEVVPIKQYKKGKPKILHALRRKKKRVLNRLMALRNKKGNPDYIAQLETKLALITYDVREAIDSDLYHRERKIVNKIKTNSKCFYSYAKSHSVIRSKIAMLISENGVVTDAEDMANLLQDQFSSVFSDPSAPGIRSPNFPVPEIISPMLEEDFIITDEQIVGAIGEVKAGSAAGPDGIPATLIKNCKTSLILPLKLLWQKSLNEGIVPLYYKISYIAPIYKNGERARAENYRPVSITSHIIKLYERILRRIIVDYLEVNSVLSKEQHGFRTGRSTLTQLFAHFDTVYESLSTGCDMDCIYLDYSKAFDKVDHRLLLMKLKRIGFNGKLITWIQSFLNGRSQAVVVDGQHSKSCSITSGVPQGTVLGPVLFLVFINDLGDVIKHSHISYFADDTRLTKKIKCEEDCKELQTDLQSTIRWSFENNMVLNEKKFQLIIHRVRSNDVQHELPFDGDLYFY